MIRHATDISTKQKCIRICTGDTSDPHSPNLTSAGMNKAFQYETSRKIMQDN